MQDEGLGGVLAFYAALPLAQKQAGQALHEYLLGLPGISCKIRYNVPFYDAQRMLCYVTLYKKALEVSFLEAKYLPDPQAALQWRNRKAIASLPLTSLKDTDWEVLGHFIGHALEVDAQIASKQLAPSILWGKQNKT